MISTRIIDILRTPDTIVAEDILLLEKEIKAYPYVQSLRALHLLGTHKFYPDNFQKVLSETAAYTTDKKILYQLINKKPLVPTPIPFVEEKIDEVEEISPDPLISEQETSLVEDSILNDPEFVEEETLIEEETTAPAEDEIEEDTLQDVEIDEEVVSEEFLDESTEEPLVEMVEEETTESIEEAEAMEEESVEVIIDSFSIETVEKTDDEELSFHGMDEFLPEVKIEANYSEISTPEVKQAPSNQLSPEDEMKRLIEAVELKMKETKKEVVEEEEDLADFAGEINFGEGYTEPIQEVKEEVKQDNSNDLEEIIPVISEQIIETEISVSEQVTSTWKPLQLETNVPDALLSKPKVKEAEPTVVEEKVETLVESAVRQNMVEEIEPSVSIAEEKIEEKEISNLPKPTLSDFPETSTGISSVQPTDSNVPNFINTWHSWLKIDRVEPAKPEADVEEIRNQAIETFIENEPRISQLRDEVTFVVKEKSDDISHLMTETLARLYIEQKLYTKAIKSFKILIEKHPEKEAYYKEVIKEIKEMRPRF